MDYKRTVSEIVTLYELEPSIRDVYVEGYSDKLVFNRFFKKYNLTDLSIKLIDDIDFKELYHDYPDIKRNNKKKSLALANVIDGTFDKEIIGLTIIVDRDFDDIREGILCNCYLTYTDYSSIELYLFNEKVINIFYENILHGFPYDGGKTINALTKALVQMFLIRLILDNKGNYSKEQIPDFTKSIKVLARKGEIKFDHEAYLFKVLNNIGEIHNKEIWLKDISKLEKKLTKDDRLNIRGHDFIQLLFHYINKVKNRIRINCETMERSLFQCLDYSLLKEEVLFKYLEEKYSK